MENFVLQGKVKTVLEILDAMANEEKKDRSIKTLQHPIDLYSMGDLEDCSPITIYSN